MGNKFYLAALIGAATVSLCSLPAMATAVEDSPPSGSDTLHWTLENTVVTYNPAAAEATRAGSQFWFVDKQSLDGRTLKMSIVAPGMATHAPHRHAEDEFFFILQGTAEFHLNGETRRVGPYTSLYCPPHSLHGIRNAGEDDLRYLVIKKYLDVQ